MRKRLLRVWIGALLLALVSAHPEVRRTMAFGLSLVIPFEMPAPWHPLDRGQSGAATPARHGVA